MADRTALRKPSAAPERRGGSAVAPRRAPAAPAPAAALRERLGGRAAGQVARAVAEARAAGSGGAPRVEVAAPRAPQLAEGGLKVSRPTDAAEVEAEATARAVARMPDPPAFAPIAARVEGGEVQRAAAASPPAAAAAVRTGAGSGGVPLPAPVRATLEPRFGASFANVRIHTGEAAARQSEALGAAAFTVGEHIHFGRGRFQPETASGRELLAHELTHTIQQGAAAQGTVAQRSPEVTVSAREPAKVQRSWLDDLDPREWLAGKAALVPGFTLLTVALGVNPITGAGVDRSAGNLLRAAIELMPGGALITRALDAYGLFDRVSAWASAQLAALTALGSGLWQTVKDILDSLSWGDLLSPGEAWARAKAMLGRTLERATALVIGLVEGIVELVRQAVLLPLAAAARGTRAYPLLCAVLGKDPITGEAAAQDAGSLLGAFMTFIGQGELWANLQKANAVPRAFAWFRGAVAALRAFVAGIPDLFVQAFRALGLEDLLDVAGAFRKVAGVFGGFVARFVSWGVESTWKLLEILFDVVSPGAFRYVKQAGAALRRVLQDPIGFVGNLVRAARLGFEGFAAGFLGHLRTGLLEWLTGALPGVYVPKSFSLVEIARFVFSVLEIGWSFIRPKLVRAVGEPAVKALETGFDLVVRLVREGPLAVWQDLQGQLASLRDTVLGGITSFVVETVVKRAIPKLVSLFIPGAGFISAIVSIYDVVMVVVQKLARIGEVVRGFVGSIASIAGGAVAAAARRIETAVAGVLSLAISFFAGFVGLGNVASKIRGVIERVRGAIGKAIDWLVTRIVAAAKRIFSFAKGLVRREKPDERTDAQKLADLNTAIREGAAAMRSSTATPDRIQKQLEQLRRKHQLTKLELVQVGKDLYIVHGEVNPKNDSAPQPLVQSIEELLAAAPKEARKLLRERIENARDAQALAMKVQEVVRNGGGQAPVLTHREKVTAVGVLPSNEPVSTVSGFASLTRKQQLSVAQRLGLSLFQDADKVREAYERNRAAFAELGYAPLRNPGDPLGKPGTASLSHAEKQAHALGAKAIGVSKDVCRIDCYPYFYALAVISKEYIVVADPSAVYVFRPEGTVSSVPRAREATKGGT